MSYSQGNEESFILDFFKGIAAGRFIDIGANDGVNGSNVRALIENFSWGGVMVEPSMEVFADLRKTYQMVPRISTVRTAVWNRLGYVDFNVCKIPGWSSIVYDHSEHRDRIIVVPVMTLDFLLMVEGVEHIDFLSIDAEGCDLDIIQNYSFCIRPRLIMIEAGHQGVEMFDTVFDLKGYRRIFTSDFNNLAYVP